MDYIFSSANPRIEPVYFAVAAIVALLAGAITARYCRQGEISKAQSIAIVLLAVYIILVFASTVFSRTPGGYYNYELMLFWSYREILQGSKFLFWEDVLNVIMLLPVGVLLPMAMLENESKSKNAKSIFLRVVFIGFLMSLTIESLQLILKCGLFEFDDMFHNTIGVAVGYWIYRQMRKFKK